jgi:hypothetical protein
LKRLIAILTLLQIFSSCIKNPVDSGDVNTSINLVNNDIGVVRLSWDKTNISTFKEYILLSSPTPIKIYKQLSEIPTNLIKQRITDIEQNIFIDTTNLQSTYYRVFVDIGSRLLISNEYYYKTSTIFLNDRYTISNSYYDEISKRIVLIDNSSLKSVISVDYQKEIYNEDYLNNILKFKSFGVGDLGLGNEMFIPSTNYISIKDVISLELKDTINTVDCSAIDVDDGKIYYSSQTKNKIVCVDRKTKKSLFELGRAFSTDLIKKVKNSNELIRMRTITSVAYMDYYHFDPNTGKVLDSIYNIGNIGQTIIDGTKTTFSKSGEFFVSSNSSYNIFIVSSKKLVKLGDLNMPFNLIGYLSYISISPNEKYIAIASTNINASNNIIIFSGISPYKEIKRYKSKLNSIQSVVIDNDNIYVVGIESFPLFPTIQVTAIETIKM